MYIPAIKRQDPLRDITFGGVRVIVVPSGGHSRGRRVVRVIWRAICLDTVATLRWQGNHGDGSNAALAGMSSGTPVMLSRMPSLLFFIAGAFCRAILASCW